MNKDIIIDTIEDVPILNSKKCKFVAFLIKIVLKYTVFIVSVVFLYFFNYYIALASGAVSFILIGVLRSSLSGNAIPITQLEFHYSDDEVARWYTAKELCFE